jgi:hypothetical protein
VLRVREAEREVRIAEQLEREEGLQVVKTKQRVVEAKQQGDEEAVRKHEDAVQKHLKASTLALRH